MTTVLRKKRHRPGTARTAAYLAHPSPASEPCTIAIRGNCKRRLSHVGYGAALSSGGVDELDLLEVWLSVRKLPAPSIWPSVRGTTLVTQTALGLIFAVRASSIGRGVGAIAYHEGRCHVDAREGRHAILRQAEHDLYGLLGHLGDGNTNGGECWSGPPGDLQVVEPDDGQLRGDCNPEGSCRLVYAECLNVGGGEDRRRWHWHGEERAPLGEAVAVVELATPDVLGVERDARGLKGGAEAGQPGCRSHHVLGAGDDGDLSVTELGQVPRSGVRAAPVRRAD